MITMEWIRSVNPDWLDAGGQPDPERIESIAETIRERWKHGLTFVFEGQTLFDNRLSFLGAVKHLVVRHPGRHKRPPRIEWSYHHREKKPHSDFYCFWRLLQLKLYGKVHFPLVHHSIREVERVLHEWLGQETPRGTGSLKLIWQWSQLDRPWPTVTAQATVFHHTWSREPRELTLLVRPKCWSTKHHLCFRVLEKSQQVVQRLPGDALCECCGLPPRSLANPKFSAALHQATVLTQLYPLWPKQVKPWVDSQHALCQYAFADEGGGESGVPAWHYQDFWWGGRRETFASVSRLMNFALHRHERYGKDAKRRLLKGVLAKLTPLATEEATAALGSRGGTFAKYLDQVKRAADTMVLFWNDESGTDDGALALGPDLVEWRQKKVYQAGPRGKPSVVYGYSAGGWKIVLAHHLLSSPQPHSCVVERISEWFRFMMEHLDSEVLSGLGFNVAFVTYAATLHQLGQKNPLQLGFARPSLALSQLMRRVATHQVYLSCTPFLNSGERMSPDHAPLRALFEADMSLCYSSLVASRPMPLASPLVYSRRDDALFRHGPHFSTSGEYKIVFHLIKDLARRFDIVKVYSQYSMHGSFVAEKKAIDLLVVYRKRRRQQLHFGGYQVHHAFTHGCPECPPLPRYARDQSAEDVRARSDRVDDFWRGYCERVLGATFQVVYFCHPFRLGASRQVGSLRDLEDPLGGLFPASLLGSRRLEPARLLELAKNPALVVLVIGEGVQGRRDSPDDAAVFTRSPVDDCAVASFQTLGPTLFHGSYLAFLCEVKQFDLRTVHHALVYPASKALQPLFQTLVQLRTHSKDSFSSRALKQALNSMIGLWGSSRAEGQSVVLVYQGYKPTSWHSHYHYSSCTDNGEVFRVSRRYFLRQQTSYLYALHLVVLQLYRLELLAFLELMQRTLRPGQWRLLQIKADSVLVGLGQPSLNACARQPKNFRRAWSSMVSEDKRPGYFYQTRLVSSREGAFALFAPRAARVFVTQGTESGAPPGRVLPVQDRPAFLRSYANRQRERGQEYDAHLLHLVPRQT